MQVKEQLDADFRSGVGRTGSDMLPYTLVNETGAMLEFSTEVQSSTRSSSRLTRVAASSKASFEFGGRALFARAQERSNNQLMIKVEGWQVRSLEEIFDGNLSCAGMRAGLS